LREHGEIKQSQTLCARGNWAVKRQRCRTDRSRFIDHRARLTHPRARAQINVGIYIYSIISLYADAVRQMYMYRSDGEPREMVVGMIEIIRSDAEIGEKIKSRRYMQATCFAPLQRKGNKPFAYRRNRGFRRLKNVVRI